MNRGYCLLLLFISCILGFSACLPLEEFVVNVPQTKPILNAVIKGYVINNTNQKPVDSILIFLKKDTIAVDSFMTSADGWYEFKVVDEDTLRQYNYALGVKFSGKYVFNDYNYVISDDSIQLKNFYVCPAGYLSLTFIKNKLSDSLRIRHYQSNCVDTTHAFVKIEADTQFRGIGIVFSEGIFRDPINLTVDNILFLKPEGMTVFDMKLYKQGKIIQERIDTLMIKRDTTINFIYKY